jgi:hypothetical protein
VAILDVRRLAAADMWGTAGRPRRRRLIRAEFAVGAVGCLLLGVFAMFTASDTTWLLVGAWLVGIGFNYVALFIHAQSLSRPGALEAELRGVDHRSALRKAGLQQLWIAVPLAVAIAALVNPSRSST